MKGKESYASVAGRFGQQRWSPDSIPSDFVHVARSFQSWTEHRDNITVSTGIWSNDHRRVGVVVANYSIGNRVLGFHRRKSNEAFVLWPIDPSNPGQGQREPPEMEWRHIVTLASTPQTMPPGNRGTFNLTSSPYNLKHSTKVLMVSYTISPSNRDQSQWHRCEITLRHNIAGFQCAHPYASTAVAVVAVVLIRYSLDPILGDSHPYILFIFPSLFLAGRVGWKAGLAVLVLGMLIANFLFASPRMSFWVESPVNQVGLLIYLAVGGACIYLADANRNVRARMIVASTLAATEARLAAIIESSEDAIISKSLDGMIRTWNAGAERLFGYSAQEAIGQPITLILLPEQIDDERSILEKLHRGERIEHHETVRMAAGGRQVHVALTISPIRDAQGRIVGASKVARDITARRKAETALWESKERLRLFLESVPVPIAMLDHEMRYLYHSHRWLKDYGLPAGNLAGLSHYEVFPDISESWKAIHQECLAGAIRRSEGDRFPRANGSVQWIRWEVHPWRLADGEIGGITIFSEDITDRKRAEETIRASDERLRQVLKGASGGAWNWNLKTGEIWWSSELYELWGVAFDTPMDVASSLAIVHGEDHEVIRKAAENAIANGVIYQCEFRIQHPSRGVLWMSSHGDVVRDESGDPTHLLGMSFDVTTRRIAEQTLRERERFLGIVTSSARVGLVVVDENYEYLFANEAYAEIFGLDPRGIIGRHVYDVIENGWQQIQPRLDRALSGERVAYELTLPSTPDGSPLRWFRAMYEPRGDDADRPTVIVVVMEITELKRSESEVRKSGELLRAVVDGTTDAIYVKDRDGQYLLFNDAASRFVGKTVEEVLGRDDADLFDPTGAASVMAWDRRVMAAGAVETEEETLTAAGMTRTYLTTKAPYRDDRGNVVGVVGISRDISERKRIADELKQSQSLLSVASRIGRMGAWSVEVPSLVATWSDELRAIYGLPHGVAPSVEEALRLHAPEHRHAMREAFQACVESGVPFDLEIQTDTHQGERLWVRVIGEAVRDVSGTVIGVQGAFQNISDRKWAEQRLMTQHAVVIILAQATDLLSAAPKFLQAICDKTGWDVGDLWVIDKKANALVCVDLWHDHKVPAAEFRDVSLRTTLSQGTGLPGRVWATRQSAWIMDVTKDKNFPRAEWAAKAGLRGGFGFPIKLGDEVLGVAEFFSRDSRPPDRELVRMFDSLGSQIGQFIERKRAESELRLFRALIDQATDGIEVIDPATGRFLDVNEKSCLSHGYSREEYLRLSVSDVDPDMTSVSWEEMTKGKLKGTHSRESTHLRKDGSTFPVETIFNAIRLDREYSVAVVRDISDRKRVEETLRLLGRAMQAVTQGIVITTPDQPDNPITYASPGFERITGYSPEEALGRNCRFLQGRDTDPTAIRRIHDAIQARQPCRVELLNYRKDGSTFWNELSIAPVWDDVGRLIHFVAVQSDVSARRNLESQFRQAQKMEAIGQLAGGVAHDFNNLLTVINGYSELLLMQMRDSDPAHQHVKAIWDAGERAASLTSQLLAFSRKSVLEPRVVDPNAVVSEMGKVLIRLIGEDIRLSTALDPRVGRLKVDPGQLGQVLMNLAVNARDAMPTGGRLTIETRAIVLDENAVLGRPEIVSGRYVMIAVSDTGQGMTENVKARVFEPFFTTKDEGRGTGLGLATVFGIIKQSGGQVEVYSEVGLGTTFKIYLPTVEEVDATTPSQDPQTVPGGKETILLVEDQADVRRLALIALQTHGYSVIEASDGQEAFRLVEQERPRLDILVTDVVMPGMSGRQLAEALRPHYPGLKVLYMSGYTDDAVVRHGILEAFVAFLRKPYTPLSLVRKVREVLDQKSSSST